MTVRQDPPGTDACTPAVDPSGTLADLLCTRHSCRAFLDRPVPRATIERLLWLAQRSASWSNVQPWEVIVTSGEGTERFRSALRKHAEERQSSVMDSDFPRPDRYEGVYLDRRRECGWQLYNAVGVARGDRAASGRQAMRNFDLFGAPHAAIITTAASQGVYGVLDCGVYVGNFLLASHSLGLAAIAQAALARYGAFIHSHFSIPDDRKVLLGISFGYPDIGHAANSYRTSRADLSSVVRWADR
jgi:nitroreductase